MTTRAIVAGERKAGNLDSHDVSRRGRAVARRRAEAAALRRDRQRDQGSEGRRRAAGRRPPDRRGARAAAADRRQERQPFVRSRAGGHRHQICVDLCAAAQTDPTSIRTAPISPLISVDKPDIWKSRDVSLPAGKGYTPVDDCHMGQRRRHTSVSGPGRDGRRQAGRDRLRSILQSSDGRAHADPGGSARSRAATEVAPQGLLGSASPTSTAPRRPRSSNSSRRSSPMPTRSAVEELGLAGNWMHGTHVAGIALAGNPVRAARRRPHRVRLASDCPIPVRARSSRCATRATCKAMSISSSSTASASST